LGHSVDNYAMNCHVTSSYTWHSSRHKPFPIGDPLEPSLYLYRFLEILDPKHIAIS